LLQQKIVILLELFLFVGGEAWAQAMLLLDECSIALKEVSGILDEFLARRHGLRHSSFRIRELLRNARHFFVEAGLIPCRTRTFSARMVIDKVQVGLFELLHRNLARGSSDRSAGTEEKSDCTDRNAGRCQKVPRVFKHNCFKWSLMTLKANRKEKALALFCRRRKSDRLSYPRARTLKRCYGDIDWFAVTFVGLCSSVATDL